MKKIQKLAAAALLAVVGLSFVPAAHAENASLAPSYANGIRHMTRDFAPNEVKRVIGATDGTTGKQLATGEGFLDAVCAFGGTSGKYSLALDSAQTPANLTVDSLSLAISPNVWTSVDSSSGHELNRDCWVPVAPVKFKNGLVGVQNSSGHSTLFFIHCSDGSNPCSL